MNHPCPQCPIADACLRWPAFCVWAAEEPPDPVKIAHIRARSGMPARRPEYPPLARQAANLARSLWGWMLDRFRVATEGERTRRLAICASCESFDPGPRRCRHLGCGCYLDAKTRMRTEHCPVGKW
jgi:hypothetical protein